MCTSRSSQDFAHTRTRRAFWVLSRTFSLQHCKVARRWCTPRCGKCLWRNASALGRQVFQHPRVDRNDAARLWSAVAERLRRFCMMLQIQLLYSPFCGSLRGCSVSIVPFFKLTESISGQKCVVRECQCCILVLRFQVGLFCCPCGESALICSRSALCVCLVPTSPSARGACGYGPTHSIRLHCRVLLPSPQGFAQLPQQPALEGLPNPAADLVKFLGSQCALWKRSE